MKRGSGILLHLTSLPSEFGIGDMGPWAYRFVDFLVETKQSFWQVLPLNPTDSSLCNSPYQSVSAFAGNPLLISPELLVKAGLLHRADLEHLPEFPRRQVDYVAVAAWKERLLQQAFERFCTKADQSDYDRFCQTQLHWLDDFALFITLKAHFRGKAWNEWPLEVRDRHAEALQEAKKELSDVFEKVRFLQYLFFKQWVALKGHCLQEGIQIIGDIPIYVHHDSADVWANPELFKLDEEMKPAVVAGVPPDYFSETGQLWGNPVYSWAVLKEQGYQWWVRRVEHNLRLFDIVRLDHFRGFVGYWEVPATEKTAIEGRWMEAPALDFFNQLRQSLPSLPVIAEDLGVITPDVTEIMRRFDFPGMKVLLFAFGKDLPTNPYIPHNLVRNCAVYTGTHDNNTVRGWFENEAAAEDRERVLEYLGRDGPIEEINWELIRLVMMSVANMAILPMQDILGLGEEARMNKPGTTEGNWEWRLLPDLLTPGLTDRLAKMTELFGRGMRVSPLPETQET